ncbi:MAG: hypothetical protein ACO23X_09115 [Vulcanococcus sp.]
MDPRFASNPSAINAIGGFQAGEITRPDGDPVSSYFECITACSIDDGECVTHCVEVLREQQ